jgi:hypothetical protein
MDATAEELLGIIQQMFPKEFDRARAELLIVKQAQRIAELERLVPDPHEHPHVHDEEGRHIHPVQDTHSA